MVPPAEVDCWDREEWSVFREAARRHSQCLDTNWKHPKQLEIYGKSMRILWEIYGKTMGNLCESLWEIYGKTMGNLWENYGDGSCDLWNCHMARGNVRIHRSRPSYWQGYRLAPRVLTHTSEPCNMANGFQLTRHRCNHIWTTWHANRHQGMRNWLIYNFYIPPTWDPNMFLRGWRIIASPDAPWCWYIYQALPRFSRTKSLSFV